ncbi:unnamed protein product [Calicophoron daubneyi]|uniref:BK channel n=1 Tax=Calicophoron daubneyi TaxID=300641 RepID=A0AAV2TFP1_CALDB
MQSLNTSVVQNTSANGDTSRLKWEACRNVRMWPVFVASSFICLFGGVLCILTYRLLRKLMNCLSSYCCARSQTALNTTASRIFRGDARNTDQWVASSGGSMILTNLPPPESLYKDSVLSICSSLPVARNRSICQRFRDTIESFFRYGHLLALRLVSYQSLSGKMFIALSMIMSLTSFGIYAYEANLWPAEVEKCGRKGRRFRTLDFSMNVFFLFHFLVRLSASQDALKFWIDWYSIVDYLTVPPTMVGFLMKRSWLGFRFVRIFRLVNISEVLHNFNIVRSAGSLKACQLCAFFVSIWLSGAGMIMLLENTGDVYGKNAYQVSEYISYTNALYFTIVTMSTVGYGDLTPKTSFGRLFVCLFILVALAAFASAIPIIAETFFSVRKYSGSYTKFEEKSHVVVCGDITTNSVRTFLSDFLHEDRKRKNVEIVFINPTMPDIQLQSILRLHFECVKYFQGTVMNRDDLRRVKMDQAEACLILASSRAADPDTKDAANIMRVIAVKNYCRDIRVIVQLLQTESKIHLLNSPYWNWDVGDEVICFSELKLGFLAQSCIAPGFSTLLTNLFSMCSQKGVKRVLEANERRRRISEINEEKAIRSGLDAERQRKRSGTVGCEGALRRRSVTRRTSTWKSALPVFMFNVFSPLHHEEIPEISVANEKSVPIVRVTPKSARNIQETQSLHLTDSETELVGLSILDENWLFNYIRGVSMEIYAARFSSTFYGSSFAEAAILCRQRLNVLLIAVVVKIPRPRFPGQSQFEDIFENTNELRPHLTINPAPDAGVIIDYSTLGFFICDSQRNASRVSHYCVKCHGTNPLPNAELKICPCQMFLRKNRGGTTASRWLEDTVKKRNTQKLDRFGQPLRSSHISSTDRRHRTTNREPFRYIDSDVTTPGSLCKTDGNLTTKDLKEGSSRRQSTESLGFSHLDMTGMYHYCQRRTFEECCLVDPDSGMPSREKRNRLINHILVCILVEDGGTPLGLNSFVMPLRASHFHANELKPIVLVGNENFLRREWNNLSCFPQVYCLPGSPLSRYDLRLAQIRYCSVCVVFGSGGQTRSDDPYMLDKEVILCSLNIRGLRFPPVKSHLEDSKIPNRRSGSEIPLITELMNDANICYLDPEDTETVTSEGSACLTATFARGIAFTSSVLDVLASTAYFDQNAMTLIRHLITGGKSSTFERWIAEGGRLRASHGDEDDLEGDVLSADELGGDAVRRSDSHYRQSQVDLMKIRQRPKLAQLSVLDPRFKPPGHSAYCMFTNFGDLFCYAIKEHGILCLGLFRNTFTTLKDLDWISPIPKSVVDSPSYKSARTDTPDDSPPEAGHFTPQGRLPNDALRPSDRSTQRYSQPTYSEGFDLSNTEPTVNQDIHEPLEAVNRYVITNPPNNFPLYRSDLVFCLCPFSAKADQ